MSSRGGAQQFLMSTVRVTSTLFAIAASMKIAGRLMARALCQPNANRTRKIAAAGFSPGAHLAACTAMIEGSEFFGNNQRFNSKPNALVLQSAAHLSIREEAIAQRRI
jgi:hypothetical protein